MERKDFLKGLSLAGAGTLLYAGKGFGTNAGGVNAPEACTLIPSETTGPYPLPTSTNVSVITRSDIKESKTGVPLVLTILVQNLDCTAIPGARVDIWHCDKDGYYSAYNDQHGYLGVLNNAGTTFLRGSQTAESNGEVVFNTIYPGWYNGRVTHIHAEIYIGNTLIRTSQFAFPDALNNTVYTTSSFYTAHGINSVTNSTDNVFSDGVTEQLLTISGDIIAGFIASHTFTVNYTVLPLTLLSVNAGIENNKATVWWATADEINLGYFTVERSNNGIDYLAVGNVIAGNRTGTNNYSFTDTALLNQNYYYRLKIVNSNGSFTYSEIVLLHAKAGSHLSVYPNPAKDKIILSHPIADGNSFVEVLSLEGKSVAYSKLPSGSSSTSVDIQLLSKGIYLLSFISSSQQQVIKFIKQ